MRLPFVMASIALGVMVSFAARTEPLPSVKKRAAVNIQVDSQGWGAVDTGQIERVLHSVADLLLDQQPDRAPITVHVSHTDSNPVALYDRGPNGEYMIRLHADQARWHLYVYEFAHEFCHVLSNYGHAGGEVSRQNQWFEETICETASLYALETLATEWSVAPPEPELASHAKDLRRFFRFLIAERHRTLPENTELREWLQERQAQLRADPYRRDQNDLVAKSVLPLFFADAKSWEAISYLNLHPDDPSASLDDFMRHWHANAPERDRPFIAKLSALLLHKDVISAPPTQVAASPVAPGGT